MTGNHVVRFAIALLILGTVASGVSIVPTVGQFSDDGTFEGNQMAAAEEWETDPPGDSDPPGDPGSPDDPGPDTQSEDGLLHVQGTESGDLTVSENDSDVELTAIVNNETADGENATVEFEIGNVSAETELTFAENESASTTFTFDPTDLGVGDHEYGITVSDERFEATVTILAEDESEFNISVDAPSVVEKGENATLDVSLENVGSGSGDYQYEIVIEDAVVDDGTVSLEGGDRWSERYEFNTDNTGDLEWEVIVDDSVTEGTLTVDGNEADTDD